MSAFTILKSPGRCLLALCLAASCALGLLTVDETSAQIVVRNDRLRFAVNKSRGLIDELGLDGQDLLGTADHVTPTPGGATGSGDGGIGPYLDCYCTPEGSYTPGAIAPNYAVFQGNDSTSTPYAGVVMGERYPGTGQLLELYVFLREGETGVHTFSRLAYDNATRPFLRNLQEFRTLFRPNTPLWTHLSATPHTTAPLPGDAGVSAEVTVQDATWYLGATPADPYVREMSAYFTKYTFQSSYRSHRAHGLWADGSATADNSTFGAWLVLNTKETYFNGPLNSDLTVDGIVYNYIVSNHHGNGTPNITTGFDRTFGPQVYWFTHGQPGGGIAASRAEAEGVPDKPWEAFYDSIAAHVPNTVTTAGRGTWTGEVRLPLREGLSNPVAVLSAEGVDFQDNTVDSTAYQYWGELEVARAGDVATVTIPRVREGRYRLTVYADGVFGDFVQDGVEVTAGNTTVTRVTWKEESAGRELWRVGRPDKSSGEFRHGYELDETKPRKPEQYRIYWAAYDFVKDFPKGVRFKIGQGDERRELNYVHWSSFGGTANFLRNETIYGPEVADWTFLFDAAAADLSGATVATLTVQLAGAKTAAGNTDVYNASQPYANLPLTATVNGRTLEPWVIPYYHSSSCAVRSAVSCYNIGHQFTFAASWLRTGENELVLGLPQDAMDYESALLPGQVYVQYDALRLEVK